MFHNLYHSLIIIYRFVYLLNGLHTLFADTIFSRKFFRSKRVVAEITEYLKNPDVIVRGNTSFISDRHPVITLMVERWLENSHPANRTDSNKVAVAIEGGGMRGCVAAGATAALHFLGLTDCVDVVYGSSAGAMVGAYFVSKQVRSFVYLRFFGELLYKLKMPTCMK